MNPYRMLAGGKPMLTLQVGEPRLGDGELLPGMETKSVPGGLDVKELYKLKAKNPSAFKRVLEKKAAEHEALMRELEILDTNERSNSDKMLEAISRPGRVNEIDIPPENRTADALFKKLEERIMNAQPDERSKILNEADKINLLELTDEVPALPGKSLNPQQLPPGFFRRK